MSGIKPSYAPPNMNHTPLATHFEIAQNKPSMSAMQPEQLKTQMPLEKQSTSHMKSLYSTIPAYHKTIDLFKIFSSS